MFANGIHNPILQEFHRKVEQWYRGGYKDHCHCARQDAYKLLLIRHGRGPLVRHQTAFKAVLDSCENELREAFGLDRLRA